MGGNIVYARTAKGEEEVRTRKYGVPMSVRRVLILVDGKSAVDRLVQSAQGIGDVPAGLAELEQGGFIQASGAPEASRSATPAGQGAGSVGSIKETLVQVANEILGKDAARIVEKIWQAPSDRDGLLASLQSCKKVVRLTISESKAKLLEEKCQEIIRDL